MSEGAATNPMIDAPLEGAFDEGAEVTFDGSSSEASSEASSETATITSYLWNFGDGQTDEGVTVTHKYADDSGDGTFTVSLTVIDDEGGSATATREITVNNVAPTVDAGTIPDADEGAEVTLNATFTDPGSGDTHTAIIDWGDNTASSGDVTEPSSPGTVSGTHTYVDNGDYTVTVTVTDDDVGSEVTSIGV